MKNRTAADLARSCKTIADLSARRRAALGVMRAAAHEGSYVTWDVSIMQASAKSWIRSCGLFAALAADMKILDDEIARAAETIRENAGGVTAAISWRDIKWYEARKAKIEQARAAVFARYDLVRMPSL